jgi:hypothetical protein
MVGSLPGCCARAGNGHAAAQPSSVIIWNDVHQEWDKTNFVRQLHIRLNYARVQLADVNVHAGARLHDVDRQEPDYEGDSRRDFKIDDRLDRHSANAGHVRHMGYSRHDGAKDDRCDQHTDQLDKRIAERAHLGSKIIHGHSQRYSQRHTDKHPDPKLLPPGISAGFLRGHRGSRCQDCPPEACAKKTAIACDALTGVSGRCEGLVYRKIVDVRRRNLALLTEGDVRSVSKADIPRAPEGAR